MSGVWADVFPFALAAGAALALVRPRYLREAYPGPQVLQRVGLFVLAAPLFFLLFIGVMAVPGLFADTTPQAVPSRVLATKALLHIALYLALPLVGLALVFGPRGALHVSLRNLFGGEPTRDRISASMAHAAALSLGLTGLLYLAWGLVPHDQQGLFAAEGARVFFSNTTPGVALLLAGAAAVAEETLFRGVLLQHLRRTVPVYTAVAFQAVAFGLIHAGYGSVLHVAAATTFGAMMGVLALRHGLVPAMIVHFLVNVVILSAWSSSGAVLLPVVLLSLLLLAGLWAYHVLGPRPSGEAQAC